MKRMISKAEERKKQKRNQLILGGLLVLLMVVSVLGIAVNSLGGGVSKQDELKFGQFEFTRNGNYYSLTLSGYTFNFITSPQELSNLSVNMDIALDLRNYSSQVMYLDSMDSYSSREIYQNLDSFLERIQPACLDEKTCPNEDYPIKTCENNMVIIREAPEDKIYQQDNCVFIEGTREDLPKLTDLYIFKILGIIR